MYGKPTILTKHLNSSCETQKHPPVTRIAQQDDDCTVAPVKRDKSFQSSTSHFRPILRRRPSTIVYHGQLVERQFRVGKKILK